MNWHEILRESSYKFLLLLKRNLIGEIMTNKGEIYACKICGNVVEVIGPGAGRLVCCGQEMGLVGNINEAEDEAEETT
jgi:desulfoferrodoxin-like iron-binding protein